MSSGGEGSRGGHSERIQEILTALLKERLRASLERVEAALVRWRADEIGAFEAHAEVLAHVARSDSLAAAMSRVGRERTASLLRAAHDAGLVDRDEVTSLTGKAPEDIAELEEIDAECGPGAGARLPAKREVVDKLLGDGPVLVHIDARCEGVSVPERLRADPKLVLRFGYQLTPTILDLDVGADALSGTLSFGGVPHRCVLPWGAVYAVVSEGDQRGMVWPDDVPPEAMDLGDDSDEPADLDGAEAEPEPAPRKTGGRGHLKLVE